MINIFIMDINKLMGALDNDTNDSIMNLSSKKIMEQNIQFGSGNNNLQLDLNALTPGTYFVQLLVEGAAGQWNVRVVVAR